MCPYVLYTVFQLYVFKDLNHTFFYVYKISSKFYKTKYIVCIMFMLMLYST